MVQLIFFLDAAQNRDRILNGGLADENRLETPGQGRVFLDMLAVFIERRRANAMQLATRQCRLQEVRGIHRAFGFSGSHQRVHLIDEEDDAAIGRCHFRQHRLQALLEFATVFGAGDQGTHVKRHQLLVFQAFGHVTLDDAERQALGNGGLADAGLADENGIVLGAA